MRQGLFIDRDGVINEDRGYDYVKSWEEFTFLPGIIETFAWIHQAGIPIIVITNQSCIGKGIVSASRVEQIHHRMILEVQKGGGKIEGVYVCPHTQEDQCDCRKPNPGLLFKAARELNLSLKQSYFVGDSVRDIEAGQRAGCRTILIKSGKGIQQLKMANQTNCLPDLICEKIEDLPKLIKLGESK